MLMKDKSSRQKANDGYVPPREQAVLPQPLHKGYVPPLQPAAPPPVKQTPVPPPPAPAKVEADKA
jgi:hypothetical protein